MLLSLLIIPIGPIISALGSWFQEMRAKLTRDSRNPYIKSDVKTFGFVDAASLPSYENDALALASGKINENDFETAKHILINAWLLIPPGDVNEPALLRLKDGFVRLYAAKGEAERASKIASLPTILLDQEVQWVVSHPDDPICGSGFEP